MINLYSSNIYLYIVKKKKKKKKCNFIISRIELDSKRRINLYLILLYPSYIDLIILLLFIYLFKLSKL